ncbi:MAG: hypothetical protein H6631_07845 [Anaerolineaceae bacterium]|nr:hypothetical protein [Anaerolineaceae bacterium]
MAGGFTQEQKTIIGETERLLHEARYNPYFAERMRTRGYNEEGWAYGESLLDTAKAAGRAKEQADSAKLGATNAYERQREQAWQQSSALARTCVVLFQGHTDRLNALGLHGRRKDGSGTSQISKPRKTANLDLVVVWQRNLFEVAQNHTEIASALAKNGFPTETLVQGAAEVEGLVRANNVQEQAKSAIGQRRKERDVAFKVLVQWLRCVKEAAELAKQEGVMKYEL